MRTCRVPEPSLEWERTVTKPTRVYLSNTYDLVRLDIQLSINLIIRINFK